MKRKNLHVFMSYIGADKDYAKKLASKLSEQPNLQVFSTEMLSAGEDWEARLKEEISKTDIFVVFISSNSVDSQWVLTELGAAWALKKRIVAVVTHPDIFSKVPLKLNETQLIDIKDIEKPEIIEKIINGYERAYLQAV